MSNKANQGENISVIISAIPASIAAIAAVIGAIESWKSYQNTEILNTSEYNRIPLKLEYSLKALNYDLNKYLETKDKKYINTNYDSVFHNMQVNFGKFIDDTKNPYIIGDIHRTGEIITDLGKVLGEEKEGIDKMGDIRNFIEKINEQISEIETDMQKK